MNCPSDWHARASYFANHRGDVFKALEADQWVASVTSSTPRLQDFGNLGIQRDAGESHDGIAYGRGFLRSSPKPRAPASRIEPGDTCGSYVGRESDVTLLHPNIEAARSRYKGPNVNCMSVEQRAIYDKIAGSRSTGVSPTSRFCPRTDALSCGVGLGESSQELAIV